MEIFTHKLSNGHFLKIREADVKDTSDILSFVHKISTESEFLTFGLDEFDISEEQEREFLQGQIDSENQIYLLALIEGTIVAILNFNAGKRPRVRHSGEFNMVVKKQYWRMGIGTILMDTFLGWAKSTQVIKKINCRVRTDNYSAIRLYERMGFVKEGTIRKEIFLKGKYYDLLWMGLEL